MQRKLIALMRIRNEHETLLSKTFANDGHLTITSQKRTFSVVASIYRGIKPKLALACD